jgi:hypothetical protein
VPLISPHAQFAVKYSSLLLQTVRLLQTVQPTAGLRHAPVTLVVARRRWCVPAGMLLPNMVRLPSPNPVRLAAKTVRYGDDGHFIAWIFRPLRPGLCVP